MCNVTGMAPFDPKLRGAMKSVKRTSGSAIGGRTPTGLSRAVWLRPGYVVDLTQEGADVVAMEVVRSHLIGRTHSFYTPSLSGAWVQNPWLGL